MMKSIDEKFKQAVENVKDLSKDLMIMKLYCNFTDYTNKSLQET